MIDDCTTATSAAAESLSLDELRETVRRLKPVQLLVRLRCSRVAYAWVRRGGLALSHPMTKRLGELDGVPVSIDEDIQPSEGWVIEADMSDGEVKRFESLDLTKGNA